MNKTRILVVEDEAVAAMNLETKLVQLGYECAGIAFSGAEAIKKAAETVPDLILMDIKLKGEMDGIEAAIQIKESNNTPIVYLTAFSDDATLFRAQNTAPYGYLVKPVRDTAIRSTIEIALEKIRLEKGLLISLEKQRALEEQLSRSNRALEQFASITSHDLKQPLRMLSTHLSLLQRKGTERSDPELERLLQVSVDGARKVGELIDDFLLNLRKEQGAESRGGVHPAVTETCSDKNFG
ncbi:MAG: response regulator [Deltaproteobacteria bacterium]|nr:response regulator [Deltaproteobacteria bacterium]MBI3294179.1 response regulator [Deltaproteobacteria bacterium]